MPPISYSLLKATESEGTAQGNLSHVTGQVPPRMEETIPGSVDSLRPSLSASPIVSGKSRIDRLRCNYYRITTVSKCGRTFNKIQYPPILQSCWISHVFYSC